MKKTKNDLAHTGRRPARDQARPGLLSRGARGDFPGVRLAESWLRTYPYQALAAQVLGYVGQITEPEYKATTQEGLPADRRDRPGGRGVGLRHVPARPRRQRPADRRLARPAEGRGGRRDDARAGEALKLTIDINLQRAAEKALTYGIGLARMTPRGPYADGGAIVALDPIDRRGAGDGVEPDVQAVGLRRRPGREEARPAPERRRRRRRTTTPASTARRAPPTRLARPGSRSRRSPRCRSTCSRRTNSSSARPTSSTTARRSRTGRR